LGRSTLSYCQHMEFVICDQLWWQSGQAI
jgi:hypothetical protein